LDVSPETLYSEATGAPLPSWVEQWNARDTIYEIFYRWIVQPKGLPREMPAQPVQLNVCPMKCLPKGNLTGMKSLLHLFHRGEAYFSGAKPPVALVLSNIHPTQVALDIDVCALVWELTT
jgi:hypothetical protein